MVIEIKLNSLENSITLTKYLLLFVNITLLLILLLGISTSPSSAYSITYVNKKKVVNRILLNHINYLDQDDR